VGSSFELSERLDEPIDIGQHHESVRVLGEDLGSMHLFDIRRSNSVSEMWKRFEYTSSKMPSAAEMATDTSSTANPVANVQSENIPASEHITSPTPRSDNNPQPLMAAFEAELANLLKSSGTSDTQAQGTIAEPAPDPSTNTGSHRIPPAVEQFMAQMLQQLCSGVGVMQTELRTRIPELQRQLSEAQRELPDNLATSLQALFTQLEAQMRTAFNNLPESGRHMAEEAYQAGRPVAETAVESLRSFATDLDQSTRTLFAAFETEFGRAGSHNTGTTTASSSAAPDVFPPPPNGGSVLPFPIQESQTQPENTPAQQKDTTASGQSSVKNPGPFNPTRPQPASNPDVEKNTQPWDHPSHPPRDFEPKWLNKWDFRSYLPPNSRHMNPLAQSPSWAPFNAGQPWHSHASAPRQYPPPPHPPSHHYNPFPFPQWPFAQPSMPQYFPPGREQPLRSSSQAHTPTPPPYTTQANSKQGGSQTETSENKTLFIGNVGFDVTEKMIQDVFASKGFIVEVDLPLDFMSGKHAGFGYLHFPSVHPAMAAMDALQGFHIDGHAINLELSDQMPIEHIPASQPSPEAAKSTSLEAQTGSAQTAPVKDMSVPQKKASGKEQAISEDFVQHNRKGSIKRSKSVTFEEPVLSSSTSNAPGAASPALIDLRDESTANAAPTWARSQTSSLGVEHPTDREMMDSGMTRFPPVSQLDAHLRASRRQDRVSVPPHGVTPGDYASFRRLSQSRQPPDVSVDRGFTFGTSDKDRLTRLPGSKDDNEISRSGSKLLPKVKRSESVKKPSEYASPLDFTAELPLRRRATERDSLRPSSRENAETDTWARLDRRERLRSRPSSTQSIPGSFPVEETSQFAATNARLAPLDAAQDSHSESIDNCISSLVDMGYGTPQEGGRSRMAVYAAASNGSLLDAIEMIEEERKAYAGQLRQ
jgi:hypothetical protein